MNSGKLVLINVFSYSCMNCLRSLILIKKINKKYKKYELETLLVHSPEWKFEKNSNNIITALKKYKTKIPLIIDKKKKIIKSLKIDFWPAQIVVKSGKIIYKHIGEGNYKKLENVIVKNLKIKANHLFQKEPKYSKFPTIYCGKRKGKPVKLDGWIQESECLKSAINDAKITIKTKGKITNFVAESLNKKTIEINIKLNLKSYKKIEINKPSLYTLIKTKHSKQQGLIIIAPKNLAIYSFSFQ